MKRLIMKLVVAGAVLTSTVGGSVVTAVPAQALDRVYCNIPSNHRVVCYNNTPYRVDVRLNIFTPTGVRTRYFTIRYSRYAVYSPAYINRITWRWSF